MVMIGYQAGYNATGNNKLYIDNSGTLSPLIYGEFDNNFVRVNGRLSVASGLTDWDNDTKIQVEEVSGDDRIRFDIAGTEQLVIRKNAHDVLLVEPYSLGNNRENTFYGDGAGENTQGSITDGRENSFFGSAAGLNNTTGESNAFFGTDAGKANQAGYFNTYIGSGAGSSSSAGRYNVLVGTSSGGSLTAGNRNTMVGFSAGGIKTGGDENTFLGYYAGGNSGTGNGNVLIGYRAGYYATGDNQLYIANDDTQTPLVYGQFDNQKTVLWWRLLHQPTFWFRHRYAVVFSACRNHQILHGLQFDL